MISVHFYTTAEIANSEDRSSANNHPSESEDRKAKMAVLHRIVNGNFPEQLKQKARNAISDMEDWDTTSLSMQRHLIEGTPLDMIYFSREGRSADRKREYGTFQHFNTYLLTTCCFTCFFTF